MNKSIMFAIGAILAFGLIFTVSDVEAKYSIADHVDKGEKIKKDKQVFDIRQVEKGSQIQSAFAIFTLDIFVGDECVIILNEEHLNKDAISKKFTCQADNTITIEKKGRDALQTKLNDEEINIVVKSITSDNQVAVGSDLIQMSIVYNAPTYFAHIENGIVTNVIVSDSNFVSSLDGIWVKITDSNFAGIGYSYDGVKFTAPQPYSSWSLDSNNTWQAPIPYPNDGNFYIWNETNLTWDVYSFE